MKKGMYICELYEYIANLQILNDKAKRKSLRIGD